MLGIWKVENTSMPICLENILSTVQPDDSIKKNGAFYNVFVSGIYQPVLLYVINIVILTLSF